MMYILPRNVQATLNGLAPLDLLTSCDVSEVRHFRCRAVGIPECRRPQRLGSGTSSGKSSCPTSPPRSGGLQVLCSKLQYPEANAQLSEAGTGAGDLKGVKWWGLRVTGRILLSCYFGRGKNLSVVFFQSMWSFSSKPLTQPFLWYFAFKEEIQKLKICWAGHTLCCYSSSYKEKKTDPKVTYCCLLPSCIEAVSIVWRSRSSNTAVLCFSWRSRVRTRKWVFNSEVGCF